MSYVFTLDVDLLKARARTAPWAAKISFDPKDPRVQQLSTAGKARFYHGLSEDVGGRTSRNLGVDLERYRADGLPFSLAVNTDFSNPELNPLAELHADHGKDSSKVVPKVDGESADDYHRRLLAAYVNGKHGTKYGLEHFSSYDGSGSTVDPAAPVSAASTQKVAAETARKQSAVPLDEPVFGGEAALRAFPARSGETPEQHAERAAKLHKEYYEGLRNIFTGLRAKVGGGHSHLMSAVRDHLSDMSQKGMAIPGISREIGEDQYGNMVTDVAHDKSHSNYAGAAPLIHMFESGLWPHKKRASDGALLNHFAPHEKFKTSKKKSDDPHSWARAGLFREMLPAYMSAVRAGRQHPMVVSTPGAADRVPVVTAHAANTVRALLGLPVGKGSSSAEKLVDAHSNARGAKSEDRQQQVSDLLSTLSDLHDHALGTVEDWGQSRTRTGGDQFLRTALANRAGHKLAERAVSDVRYGQQFADEDQDSDAPSGGAKTMDAITSNPSSSNQGVLEKLTSKYASPEEMASTRQGWSHLRRVLGVHPNSSPESHRAYYAYLGKRFLLDDLLKVPGAGGRAMGGGFLSGGEEPEDLKVSRYTGRDRFTQRPGQAEEWARRVYNDPSLRDEAIESHYRDLRDSEYARLHAAELETFKKEYAESKAAALELERRQSQPKAAPVAVPAPAAGSKKPVNRLGVAGGPAPEAEAEGPAFSKLSDEDLSEKSGLYYGVSRNTDERPGSRRPLTGYLSALLRDRTNAAFNKEHPADPETGHRGTLRAMASNRLDSLVQQVSGKSPKSFVGAGGVDEDQRDELRQARRAEMADHLFEPVAHAFNTFALPRLARAHHPGNTPQDEAHRQEFMRREKIKDYHDELDHRVRGAASRAFEAGGSPFEAAAAEAKAKAEMGSDPKEYRRRTMERLLGHSEGPMRRLAESASQAKAIRDAAKKDLPKEHTDADLDAHIEKLSEDPDHPANDYRHHRVNEEVFDAINDADRSVRRMAGGGNTAPYEPAEIFESLADPDHPASSHAGHGRVSPASLPAPHTLSAEEFHGMSPHYEAAHRQHFEAADKALEPYQRALSSSRQLRDELHHHVTENLGVSADGLARPHNVPGLTGHQAAAIQSYRRMAELVDDLHNAHGRARSADAHRRIVEEAHAAGKAPAQAKGRAQIEASLAEGSLGRHVQRAIHLTSRAAEKVEHEASKQALSHHAGELASAITTLRRPAPLGTAKPAAKPPRPSVTLPTAGTPTTSAAPSAPAPAAPLAPAPTLIAPKPKPAPLGSADSRPPPAALGSSAPTPAAPAAPPSGSLLPSRPKSPFLGSSKDITKKSMVFVIDLEKATRGRPKSRDAKHPERTDVKARRQELARLLAADPMMDADEVQPLAHTSHEGHGIDYIGSHHDPENPDDHPDQFHITHEPGKSTIHYGNNKVSSVSYPEGGPTAEELNAALVRAHNKLKSGSTNMQRSLASKLAKLHKKGTTSLEPDELNNLLSSTMASQKGVQKEGMTAQEIEAAEAAHKATGHYTYQRLFHPNGVGSSVDQDRFRLSYDPESGKHNIEQVGPASGAPSEAGPLVALTPTAQSAASGAAAAPAEPPAPSETGRAELTGGRRRGPPTPAPLDPESEEAKRAAAVGTRVNALSEAGKRLGLDSSAPAPAPTPVIPIAPTPAPTAPAPAPTPAARRGKRNTSALASPPTRTTSRLASSEDDAAPPAPTAPAPAPTAPAPAPTAPAPAPTAPAPAPTPLPVSGVEEEAEPEADEPHQMHFGQYVSALSDPDYKARVREMLGDAKILDDDGVRNWTAKREAAIQQLVEATGGDVYLKGGRLMSRELDAPYRPGEAPKEQAAVAALKEASTGRLEAIHRATHRHFIREAIRGEKDHQIPDQAFADHGMKRPAPALDFNLSQDFDPVAPPPRQPKPSKASSSGLDLARELNLIRPAGAPGATSTAPKAAPSGIAPPSTAPHVSPPAADVRMPPPPKPAPAAPTGSAPNTALSAIGSAHRLAGADGHKYTAHPFEQSQPGHSSFGIVHHHPSGTTTRVADVHVPQGQNPLLHIEAAASNHQNAYQKDLSSRKVKTGVAHLIGGAAAGAAVGTAVAPGLGTAVGGTLGAIGGLYTGVKRTSTMKSGATLTVNVAKVQMLSTLMKAQDGAPKHDIVRVTRSGYLKHGYPKLPEHTAKHTRPDAGEHDPEQLATHLRTTTGVLSKIARRSGSDASFVSAVRENAPEVVRKRALTDEYLKSIYRALMARSA